MTLNGSLAAPQYDGRSRWRIRKSAMVALRQCHRVGDMRRREFLGLIGGAGVLSVAVHAQQATMPVVGFLHGATPEAYAPQLAAFRKSLGEAGYSEGQNVTVELRWAEGRLERLAVLAADLLRRPVSVIFAGGGAEPALAAKAATSKIPVVFANGVDPVEVGLVASLSRPGGNITGVTFLINTLGPKELEALHDLRPEATVFAALINPDLATTASQSKDVEMAARALGLQIRGLHASAEREIDTVFESLPQVQAGGLVIGANAFLFSRRDQLVELATRYSVPTIYPWREAVVAGGLMSYGANVADAYGLAGTYIGRILKGEKPADLPVQQSTNTELVVNLKTAKSLGLVLPITLLGRANEVIE
jgi:putative tryptophan/tyrosine transport system substrate-binding protein